jgi:y4mF family transcriptional regulator
MSTKTSKAFETLSERLRTERKSQNLSQTQLAQLSQVSLNFLSQLESGKSTVQLDKVLQVMNTLGLEFKIQYGKNGINQ